MINKFAFCLIVLGWNLATQGQQFPSANLIQNLKWLPQIPGRGLVPSNKVLAVSLVKAIEAERNEFPARREFLAFYLADAKYIADGGPRTVSAETKEDIVMFIGPVARDLADCNCLEARTLLYGLGRSPLGEPFPPKTSPMDATAAFEAALIEVFPVGSESDHVTLKKQSKDDLFVDLGTDELPFRIRHESIGAKALADGYRRMGYPSQALSAYHLAIGMEGLGATGDEAIYMSIGDCLATQGKWDQALGYYLKSLASGQALADITPKMRDMDKAINEKRKVPELVKEKPDRVELERIAGLLADTDLFDQAIEAAELARKADPAGASAELLPSLHRRKAALLQRVIDALGEGPVVRGTKATKENVAKEMEMAVKK
jgi:hypothetical protein